MSITSKKSYLFQCSMLLLFISFKVNLSNADDTISPGQSLSGNQTITSLGGIFELGFFTPGNSQNYYIGIWYKNLPKQTVVWVANREQPISNPSSSALRLSEDGNVVLLDHSKTAIWSTNSTSKVDNSAIAMLLDNGNFVIRDALDSSNVIWQSFYHPTDTWLPGGKIGYNKLTNEKQSYSAWRNPQNPAPAIFTLEVEQNGTSHLLLWNGSKVYWTSGEWTGKIFTQAPEIELEYSVTNFTYVSNENESYFTYDSADPTAFARIMIDVTGQLKQFAWPKNSAIWQLFWMRPTLQCEVYAYCGSFSVCNHQKEPLCVCMGGFEPKMPKDWELGDHTNGCARRTPLECINGGKDKFFVMHNILFPVDSESLTVETIEECELACLCNCSCTAFAYDNGCLIWKGDMFNLQQVLPSEKIGKDFHLRVAASERIATGDKASRKITWIYIGAIAGYSALLGLVLVVLWRRLSIGAFETVEGSLIVFKYRELRSVTRNFSEKLGEGGFGSVFKGTLLNSTAIAVKKLKTLEQEEKQFHTEITTIGMIQHINLVRLRGFCVEASKRFLVYDYMPNGSLEALLFRKSTRLLDWRSRYNIAIGTAKGLAYLHEECRDCIIHLDIKPENILLDAEYNPKVADFGLAKLLGRDFSRVLTTMRGTIGYLAPEWISGEAVTPKADVFSYGMLLIEIISGRRNRDRLDDGTDDYFPTRVADTVNKGQDVLNLLDERLEGNAIIEELTRACKVACWCIQGNEKARPTMGQVVRILEGISEVETPPIPRFLQLLAENPPESMVYQETSSSDVLA